jgi:hypothetical protein
MVERSRVILVTAVRVALSTKGRSQAVPAPTCRRHQPDRLRSRAGCVPVVSSFLAACGVADFSFPFSVGGAGLVESCPVVARTGRRPANAGNDQIIAKKSPMPG